MCREIEKLKLSEMTCREGVIEVAKIIYKVHDEAKDKAFELEMSWVCDESKRLHEKDVKARLLLLLLGNRISPPIATQKSSFSSPHACFSNNHTPGSPAAGPQLSARDASAASFVSRSASADGLNLVVHLPF
uniref:Uncharacterized protein n=1 Tax=Salix viminalis TaxID=40686 RepID=A0A6N2N0R2_SALVM